MSFESIRQYYQKTTQPHPKKPHASRDAFGMLLSCYLQESTTLLAEAMPAELLPDTAVPDGTLKDRFSLVYGYWYHLPAGKISEKTPQDSRKPYLLHTNTLLEDGQQAVLFQQNREVMRAAIPQPEAMNKLLLAFVQYQPPQVQAFIQAFSAFAAILPAMSTLLRQQMAQAEDSNPLFTEYRSRLLEQWRTEVHPQLRQENIHTMLVHHLLAENLFEAVFTGTSFFKENPIALSAAQAAGSVLSQELRRKLQDLLQPLIQATVRVSRQLNFILEKQHFLAGIYAGYRAAYAGTQQQEAIFEATAESALPRQSVLFMITATDLLLQKYLDKRLSDRDMEVLDPFAGPELFLPCLSTYLCGQVPTAKGGHSLHGSTPELLSYYLTSLALTSVSQQQTADSPLLCFTDTPANTGALPYAGSHQLFASHSENLQAIQQQNSRRFSVVIGKPPTYGQTAYPATDTRIRETFGRSSYAVRNRKPYGMPMRYYRWAMDRLHTSGIISFFTDRRLLSSPEISGFRKTVAHDFDEAYIIDLPESTEPSAFQPTDTQEGAAMIFLVRHASRNSERQKGPSAAGGKATPGTDSKRSCRIHYTCLPPASSEPNRLRKQAWQDLSFSLITPDTGHRWTGAADKPELLMLPLQDSEQNAVFSLSTPGLKVLQDAWLYDRNKETLAGKAQYFIQQRADTFHPGRQQAQLSLESLFTPAQPEKQSPAFSGSAITGALYRPFTRMQLYFDKALTVQAHHWPEISRISDNIVICIPGPASSQEFYALATDSMADHRLMPAGGRCFPLYFLDEEGQRQHNVTAQALQQVRTLYALQEKQKKNTAFPEVLQQTLQRLQQESNALPILRKHYQQLQQQLTAAAGSYKAASLLPVQEIISRFQQEVAQRKQEAVERKALYQRLHNYLHTLGEQLSQLSLQHRQAEDITPEAVFHYTYAIFHHTPFRRQVAQGGKHYEIMLPFYADFWQWADWGERLLTLHITYESATPYPLERRAKEEPEEEPHDRKKAKKKTLPKAVLSADPGQHMIQLDEHTSLHGIPDEAWLYRLGRYTALEWVLRQYREKTPKDDILRKKFHTYRFADYREEAADLLQRVCTVSLETVKIVREMEKKAAGLATADS